MRDSRTVRALTCPPNCAILPSDGPSDPTAQELSEGVQPFDGGPSMSRCRSGRPSRQPVKHMLGSRIAATAKDPGKSTSHAAHAGERLVATVARDGRRIA